MKSPFAPRPNIGKKEEKKIARANVQIEKKESSQFAVSLISRQSIEERMDRLAPLRRAKIEKQSCNDFQSGMNHVICKIIEETNKLTKLY